MTEWQKSFLILFSALVFMIFLKGFFETKNKSVFEETPFLLPLGIFVWGDAVVFGLFWVGVSVFSLLIGDWILFLLTYSVFWIVRSFGETVYWLNQQFSAKNLNPPERLLFHKFFPGKSIWFVYQIFWQTIMVVSIICSLYLTKLWLWQN